MTHEIVNEVELFMKILKTGPDALAEKFCRIVQEEVQEAVVKFFNDWPLLKIFFPEVLNSNKSSELEQSSIDDQLSQEDTGIVNALVKQFGFKKQDCLEALKKVPADFSGGTGNKIMLIINNLAQR